MYTHSIWGAKVVLVFTLIVALPTRADTVLGPKCAGAAEGTRAGRSWPTDPVVTFGTTIMFLTRQSLGRVHASVELPMDRARKFGPRTGRKIDLPPTTGPV